MNGSVSSGAIPDPARSRAVLVGVSDFTHLPNLPSVSRNVIALSSALCNVDIWGMPPNNCAIVQNPKDLKALVAPIDEASSTADDTLMIYYSGHGLVDHKSGDLHLALPDSVSDRSYTAVPYDLIRQQVIRSSARRKLVILDCCYSGRALGLMGLDASTAVAEEASVEGTFVIASAPENSSALAPEGENFTAFTGELLDVLERGVSSDSAYLDLDLIYRRVLDSLKSKSRPLPQKRERNTAGRLIMARNRAHLRSRLMSNLPSDDIGQATQAFNRRFTHREVLHRTPTTEVSRYLDHEFDRHVAIRFSFAEKDQQLDTKLIRQFRQETQIAAACAHYAVVPVFESGVTVRESREALFVIMEDMDGESLRSSLSSIQRSEHLVEELTYWLNPVMMALSRIHEIGIVHRNVSPETILSSALGGVKLGGLNLASDLSDLQAQDKAAFAVDLSMGYTAPEIAARESISHRSDIYSVGCILYEILAGRPVFQGESDVELAYQHIRKEPTPPSVGTSSLGMKSLESVALKALSKDPENRHGSISEMHAELARAIDFTTASTNRPESSLPVRRYEPTTTTESCLSHSELHGAGLESTAGRSVKKDPSRTARSERSGGLGYALLLVLVFALTLALAYTLSR